MPVTIKANKGYRNTTYPRLENENEDVFIGSSLAVVGLWVFFLRQRFRDSVSQALPWIWQESFRPADDEDNEPRPDGSPVPIEIESMYNVEKLNRDYRPSIYVGRGGNPITPWKQHVDNYVGEEKRTQFKAYHMMINMPLVLDIKSASVGECCVLGDIVWSFILATRDIARHDFGLHDVTEPSLSDVRPSKKDKDIWEAQVSFNVQLDQRWGTVPIAPKLRDILLTIASKNSNLETYLTKIAVQDTVGL